MAETKEKICRLCLSYEDSNFTKLDTSTIGKAKAVIPELISALSSTTLICSKCRDILERSFELKRTISKNNDLIKAEKQKSKLDRINLSWIVKDAKSEEGICRICFMSNEGKYRLISKDSKDEFNNVLFTCAPELDVYATSKPASCSPCYDLLQEMCKFKKDCMAVEDKIQSCCSSTNPRNVDLNKVLKFNKSEEESLNDFLSGFEVQDEEGTDIFDSIPNTEEPSRKRTATEIAAEQAEAKKRKLMTAEIKAEELPPFNFTVSLLYNPCKSDIMVEDWLEKVEEYKKKFNWSDSTTIHKVLIKLKDMKELYIWFSNIADIMNWEQWKKKLVRAFPLKTDYHIIVKRMSMRRKKREETYADYYHEKMKLMEPLNLTDEQKVSCIFGGISEVLVCCVGRVGDYKTPEELLDYFKSCDDKQSLEAAAKEKKKEEKPAIKVEKNFPKPVQHVNFSPQNQTGEKKKKRCFQCRRQGHSAVECQFKTKKPADQVDLLKVKKSPGINEAKVKRPQNQKGKGKGPIVCHNCNKPGHTFKVCPLISNHTANVQLHPPKKQKEVFRDRRRKGQQEVWSRCMNCGKFGAPSNPCCSAKVMSFNGNYVGAYTPQIPGSNQICLNCYKIGHETNQCPDLPYRGYRN